jgi:hypothetical protein
LFVHPQYDKIGIGKQQQTEEVEKMNSHKNARFMAPGREEMVRRIRVALFRKDVTDELDSQGNVVDKDHRIDITLK